MVMHPGVAAPEGGLASSADRELAARLLAGDEAAFQKLFVELHPLLLRLASTIVRSAAIAEEVAQDTWLAVLEGLPRFEARSSLKTWIVRILFNRARTRAVREVRSIPFSALSQSDTSVPGPEAFTADGAWREPVAKLGDAKTPEHLLSNQELRASVERAIAELPEQQRLVLELRDVAELDASEVCALLELSEANQRVLLHRARHKVRAALAEHSS